VLDIGCTDKRLSRQLPADCFYIGLDYLDTAVGMYGTRPDVFADATTLPFENGCMDAVILKDVLEHVGGPHRALSEIGRVMRDGGRLMLWMPFIYPIHDAPFDFQRFTEHGLRRYLSECGFVTLEFTPVLKPAETASLMICLALADTAEQILLRRRWLLPLLPVLALFVLLTNLTGKLFGLLPATQFMPAFYRVMAVRKQGPHAEGTP
jgi:SAM-dependent methyltransferase